MSLLVTFNSNGLNNFPRSLSVMSEVTWNRKKGPVKREEKSAKYFITANYAEIGVEKLLEDFNKLQDEASTLCGPEGTLEMLSCWEERGLDTGNPHFHGIIVFKREHRCRCP